MIKFVPQSEIDSVWWELIDKIERGLKYGAGQHFTIGYYYQQLKNGTMSLWVTEELNTPIACGILSVVEYPNKKTLFVELIAGEKLDAWLSEAEPLLHRYADQVGASTIEALCRPGLVKKLTKWRPIATLMRLDNGR